MNNTAPTTQAEQFNTWAARITTEAGGDLKTALANAGCELNNEYTAFVFADGSSLSLHELDEIAKRLPAK